MNYCYLNGKILSEAQAGLNLWDIGILRGYGVFDGSRTFDGRVFHFADHWQRLERSAHALHLRLPLAQTEALRVLHVLLKKNRLEHSDSSVRTILTGGPSPDGIRYDPKTPTFFVLVRKFQALPAAFYQNGVSLLPYEYQRFLPEVKDVNYLTTVMLQPELDRTQSIEPLYIYRGHVLESSNSNFFIFRGSRLITAKAGVLMGITRKVVLALARKSGFAVEQRQFTVGELRQASEAFITSSYKDVLPVIRVGRQLIGNGRVGANTKILMDAYASYARSGVYNLK